MRKFLFVTVLLVLVNSLSAQTKLSGTVMDQKNKPVSGVSISIKDSYDGATTDASGNFSFETMEKGTFILVATGIGFKPFEQAVELNGNPLTIQIALKEQFDEMKAVVITAGSFEASDKKRTTVLSSIDILTTASANADVTGAIKTLPGAQQVGESEGLFVRGGTAGETRTYIDGSLVNNFFYSSVPNVAQRGRFSPWILKGTVFSAGGYSALYGQALSSALILETIDLPEQSSANLGVSVIGASGGLQKLSKNKKASWGFSYGYTNLELAFKVLKQKQDFFRVPDYHTADANFRIRTSSSGILKYYGYFSANKLGFTTPSLDTPGFRDAFRLKNFNIYHNLSWRENLGNNWKINTGISYTNNKDDIAGNLHDDNNNKLSLPGFEFKEFALDSRSNFFNAKVVFERRLHGLSAFRFGSEYNFSDERNDMEVPGGKYPNNVKEHMKAGFGEADIYLTNDLAAKLGVRAEHSSLLDKMNVSPRISLAYKVGRTGQASLAYGTFYQNPERRYLPSPVELQFSKATHYIAQYQKVTGQTTFRAEAFYKKYKNLLKTGVVNYMQVATGNSGYGDAKGIEFFWRDKKTIKNVDYWVSYSYLDTKRDFLNYPQAIQPSFAARHTGSLVVKKFVSKMKTQFNGSYTYASGRPYYNIRYDNASNQYKMYDQGKTIDYNSVSLSVNYLPNIFGKGANKFTVLVFSVTNVLGSKQVFGYNYSYNGLRREAIVPPTKTFVFLGAFFSFGVDRSQDAINNNL
jgi:hypothetical protein